MIFKLKILIKRIIGFIPVSIIMYFKRNKFKIHGKNNKFDCSGSLRNVTILIFGDDNKIEIECVDCSTLYLNGNDPIHAQKATFLSEKPYELSLFCGNYEYIDDGNLLLLNPTFAQDDINYFSRLVAQYKKYYEKKLNIQFSEPPIFVNSTPTAPNYGWLFVSYPTIMGIGYGNLGLGALFDKKQNWYEQLIAHELGHYYFGTYKVFNSELGGMMSEGFAEYLSLKLFEELKGKKSYDQLLEEKFEILKTFNTLPISKINTIRDIRSRKICI